MAVTMVGRELIAFGRLRVRTPTWCGALPSTRVRTSGRPSRVLHPSLKAGELEAWTSKLLPVRWPSLPTWCRLPGKVYLRLATGLWQVPRRSPEREVLKRFDIREPDRGSHTLMKYSSGHQRGSNGAGDQ